MKKILIIIFLIITSINIFSQITVQATNISGSKGDSIVVPITVTNFDNIGAITIKLKINSSELSWGRALNWNNQIKDGLVGLVNDEIVIAWDDENGVNIGNGKLLDLKFLYFGGNTNLVFDIAQCEIADIKSNLLDVNYIDGLVTEVFPVNININSNPKGRIFIVDGNSYSSQQTFVWIPGSKHLIGTDSIQGNSETRYLWKNWSDGGNILHEITIPEDTITYTSSFVTQYYFTNKCKPYNAGIVYPLSGWYSKDTVFQIEAKSNQGYLFNKWVGEGNGSYTGSNKINSIALNSPVLQSALFEHDTVKIKLLSKKIVKQDSLILPLTVDNFFNIGSFKFTVKFDTSILNWLRIYKLNDQIDSLYVSNKKGTVTMVGEGPSGISLPNDSTLFSMMFYIKNLDTSEVNFIKDSSNILDINDSILTVEYENCQISTIDNIDCVENNNKIYNYYVSQNYPNPFNPTTTIKYEIPKANFVTIKVFNILGKEVASLVNENKKAGDYNVEFNANKLSSGVYFYRIKAGSFVETKKLILLK